MDWIREPFNVKNEKNLLLVSRYLVENNEESYVILDYNKTSETLIIKSIFKKLVGNYTLLSQNEEKLIYEKISTVQKFCFKILILKSIFLNSNKDLLTL